MSLFRHLVWLRVGAGLWLATMLMPVSSSAQSLPLYRYLVSVDESLERLEVRACFHGNVPRVLATESGGTGLYLEDFRVGNRVLQPEGDVIVLGDAPENACVDYKVTLQPAQTRGQTGGPETRRVGRDLLTSIGDWLWRPKEIDEGADLQLSFNLPAGVSVSVPWPRVADIEGRPTFRLGPTPYNWSGVAAFGHFTVRDIAVPGAVLRLALLDGPAPERQVAIERWVTRAARHVTTLYGRFPVESVQVIVAPTLRGRGPVPWAYVSRGGGPGVHLFINPNRPSEEFERDWSATHEMSHLFLPYVASRDAWLFEGLATYLQNVLMVRGGAISREEGWRRLRFGFQRGARAAPGLSLVQASERVGFGGTYLRVYWAGAALMLAADLQLRSQTGGRESLDTALDELSHCCLTRDRRWSAQELVAKLDEVTGTTVFSDVVRAQLASSEFPDFGSLLERAGVRMEGESMAFDPAAPLAAARDALMRIPASDAR